MLDFIKNIMEFDFLQNAIFAIILISICCAIIGTYIVTKRIVFISSGITHASFGGIGIAYYLGLNPIIGAITFAILSAVGVESLKNRNNIRIDSAIGIVWALGMAIGIIFIHITPGYTPNLMSFLFGSILNVTTSDVVTLLLLTIALSVFFFIFGRVILFVAFDEDYAKIHGVKTQLVSTIMMIFVALTVVLVIKVIGIILVISMLTIPQSIAQLFTKKYYKIIFASIPIAFFASLFGLWISFNFNTPSGATIIVFLVAIYVITFIFHYLYSKFKRVR